MFSQLCNLKKYVGRMTKNGNTELKTTQHAIQLYDSVQKEGLATLLKLLHEKLPKTVKQLFLQEKFRILTAT